MAKRMNAEQYLQYLGSKCRYDDFVAYMTSQSSIEHVNEFHRNHGFSTKYDSTTIRKIGVDRCREIYADMELVSLEMSNPQVEPITVGYLPIHDYNACATRSPNGQLIVLLDVGLDVALQLVALAVVYTNQNFQKKEIDPLQVRLYFELLYNAMAVFADLVPDRPFNETWSQLDYASLPTLELQYAAGLKEAMTLFILAHEHAHHCYGHLDMLALRNLRDGPQLSVFNRSQQQELEADLLGFNIYLQCSKAESKSNLPYLKPFPTGPLIFFAWLQSMEEFMNCTNTATSSHPTSKDRILHLKSYIEAHNYDLDDTWFRYSEWLFSMFRLWASSANTRKINPLEIIMDRIHQEKLRNKDRK